MKTNKQTTYRELNQGDYFTTDDENEILSDHLRILAKVNRLNRCFCVASGELCSIGLETTVYPIEVDISIKSVTTPFCDLQPGDTFSFASNDDPLNVVCIKTDPVLKPSSIYANTTNSTNFIYVADGTHGFASYDEPTVPVLSEFSLE